MTTDWWIFIVSTIAVFIVCLVLLNAARDANRADILHIHNLLADKFGEATKHADASADKIWTKIARLEADFAPLKKDANTVRDMDALRLRVQRQTQELHAIKAIKEPEEFDTDAPQKRKYTRTEALKKARLSLMPYAPGLGEQVLDILAKSNRPMSATDVARQVMRKDGTRGAMLSSTTRQLQEYYRDGLLERDPKKGKKGVGRKYWAAQSNNVVALKA